MIIYRYYKLQNIDYLLISISSSNSMLGEIIDRAIFSNKNSRNPRDAKHKGFTKR